MKNQPFSARRLLVPVTIIFALGAACLLVTDALQSGDTGPGTGTRPQRGANHLPASLAPVATRDLYDRQGEQTIVFAGLGSAAQCWLKSKTKATGQFIGRDARMRRKSR